MPIGPWEMLIILFIVLLLFGAKRVPEMGRSLGSGMREFKEAVTNPFRDDEPKRPAELERGQARAEAQVDSVPSERVSSKRS
jgi:sec-independent protein translocase protein TatA